MNITSTSNSISSGKSFGFWGNLLLSRKLLIAFGTLFVFALIIAIITLSGLNRTTAAYEDAFAQGIQVRSISDHLQISLLQARQAEKNFLLRWQSEGFTSAYTNYVPTFSQETATVRQDIGKLALLGEVAATVSTGDMTQSQYNADINSLILNVNTYVENFNVLVDAYRKKGFDENTGFEGEIRTVAHAIEEQIRGQAGLEQLDITLLEIRRNEKDYLARGDQQYIDQVRILISQLKLQIAATDQLTPELRTELRTQADAYLTTFNTLVELDKEIAIYNEELNNAARAVEPFVTKFESLGEQLAADDVNKAQTNSSQTLTFSIITIMVVLALTVIISITLSRQITRPVTLLTNTAEQIALGNFDTQAEVSSGDEIGALAQTFNTMTSRLRQAFEDVRRRSLAVQTSAEVSRRLSMATNPRQLAVDVVEQVQSAFKYYHAHIYFLDEASGDLIMAGGTGEAGTTMMARNHKVQKGRGLVGRAAATNTPVLVPDVSKEDGWLPNALLPDTKSEAAIPISSGSQVLGVLDVQQNVVNALGEEDVALLQSLAGQVAISLQNARTFEESRAKAELESMVNAIGQKIQRTTTVNDTLQTAIREIGLALGASRVSANIGINHPNDVHEISRN